MNYREAQELSFKVTWKVEPCHQGESCWCRMIVPETPIIYDEEEFYLVGSAAVSMELAEYIVKLHNKELELLKA